MHVEDQNHAHIVEGNLEVLEQGMQLVLQLTDKQYNTSVPAYSCSSIGQHFRHVLDMYQAVLPALTLPAQTLRAPTSPAQTSPALANSGTTQAIANVIDYDTRRRGASVETQRKTAIEELRSIKQHIEHRTAPLCLSIDVKTEVCVEHTRFALIPSTLARELAFVSAHAVHHFALMKVIGKMLGASLDQSFGLAPASASHQRAQQLEQQEQEQQEQEQEQREQVQPATTALAS